MFQRLAILFGLALLTFSVVRASPLPFNDDFETGLFRRETWGKGAYTVDLTVYHSQVKPQLKQAFVGAYKKKFTDFCGTNPDFMVDKSGMVTASSVGGKKGKDCSQKNFPALDLGSVIKSFVKAPSPEPESPRSGSPVGAGKKKREESFDYELFRRETWGKGAYTVDLAVYHSQVKPQLKQAFVGAYKKKFTDFCGTNPDFMVDKSGMVTASSVGGKKGKDCSQKNFPPLDLGSVIKSFVKAPSPAPESPRSGSPVAGKKRSEEGFEYELFRRETWGKGAYTVDLAVYHSQVKPQLKQAFVGAYKKKFTDFCGTNPDFMVDKSGMVTASSVGGKKGKDCSQKNFPPLDLGSVIKSFVKAPSPAPESPRSGSPVAGKKRSEEDFEAELLRRGKGNKTWGAGPYTIDLDVYHKTVKPKLQQAFQAEYPNFASSCGTNPDYMVDRKGYVTASSVQKSSACNQNKFPALKLGHLIV